MSKRASQVPDILLERAALGELKPGEAERLGARSGEDAPLQVRLEELARSDAEILEAHPPRIMALRIEARAEEDAAMARRKRLPFLVAVPAMCAIALVATLALREPQAARYGASGDATRMKGGPASISLFIKEGAHAKELPDGSPARAGDLLQIGYAAGGAAFGVIFSVDGRGTITFHLPSAKPGSPAASPRLETGALTMLAQAYELDDAPLFERFFFVFSEKSFDLGAVSRAAGAIADAALSPAAAAGRGPERMDPPLPPGLQYRSLLVMKPAGAP
jgi:hypothetical protein